MCTRLLVILLAVLLVACGPTCDGEWVVVGEEDYLRNTGICLVWVDAGGGTEICASYFHVWDTRPVKECRAGRM